MCGANIHMLELVMCGRDIHMWELLRCGNKIHVWGLLKCRRGIHMWELLMCGRDNHMWKGAFIHQSYSHVEGKFMCVGYSCVERTFMCRSYTHLEGHSCVGDSHLWDEPPKWNSSLLDFLYRFIQPALQQTNIPIDIFKLLKWGLSGWKNNGQLCRAYKFWYLVSFKQNNKNKQLHEIV